MSVYKRGPPCSLVLFVVLPVDDDAHDASIDYERCERPGEFSLNMWIYST